VSRWTRRRCLRRPVPGRKGKKRLASGTPPARSAWTSAARGNGWPNAACATSTSDDYRRVICRESWSSSPGSRRRRTLAACFRVTGRAAPVPLPTDIRSIIGTIHPGSREISMIAREVFHDHGPSRTPSHPFRPAIMDNLPPWGMLAGATGAGCAERSYPRGVCRWSDEHGTGLAPECRRNGGYDLDPPKPRFHDSDGGSADFDS
jgi:hypothetical protein